MIGKINIIDYNLILMWVIAQYLFVFINCYKRQFWILLWGFFELFFCFLDNDNFATAKG